LRARPKAVLASCVLFTIALLLPLPAMLENAATWRRLYYPGPDETLQQNLFAPIGFASLAVIFIGLVVAWTGYRQRLRWAYLVMLLILSVWAFPVLLLPFLQQWRSMVSIREWLPLAIEGPGLAREFVLSIFVFLLMAIALLLPIKSFVRKQESDADPRP
jgi:hypothetical protein